MCPRLCFFENGVWSLRSLLVGRPGTQHLYLQIPSISFKSSSNISGWRETKGACSAPPFSNDHLKVLGEDGGAARDPTAAWLRDRSARLRGIQERQDDHAAQSGDDALVPRLEQTHSENLRLGRRWGSPLLRMSPFSYGGFMANLASMGYG